MPWVLLSIGALGALIAVLVVRTITFPLTPEPVPAAELLPVDAPEAAAHLAAIIQCETISHSADAPPEAAAFAELHARLRAMYPRVYAALELETVNDWSLLYTWPGSNPALDPVLFLAHTDVVPVDAGALDEWKHPPFSGAIADGFVWGRGTLDVKCQVTGLLDAVEALLATGFQPERPIMLAFGHDEEIEGQHGAQAIVALLQERGIHPAAVLDEGGALIEGVLAGVEGPVALIGTGEKGQVTLELVAEAAPGHSSTPPRQTAIGILGRALARLEANPMPARVSMLAPVIQHVGARAPLSNRAAFANLWLLRGVLRRVLAANPQTNAIIRTTTAATIVNGGIKENVLPRQARASINCRLLPGESIADVAEHLRRVIADDRVRVIVPEGIGNGASPLSPTDSPYFASIARAARQVFGDIPTAPYLMLGASDSRHYTAVCDRVYRFEPVRMTETDLGRIHGNNERISVASVGQMVQFYAQLMQVWGQGEVA